MKEEKPTFIICATGGLETDLEQEQDDAEPRERIDGGVAPKVVEPVEPGEREIAQHDAGGEFAQHGRLAKGDGEMRADLGGHEDDRQRENQRGDRIPVNGFNHGLSPLPTAT
jgi:hypothetical protein